MRTCAHCGGTNPDEVQSCASCGRTLVAEVALAASGQADGSPKASRLAIASLVCGMLIFILILAIAVLASRLDGTLLEGLVALLPILVLTASVLGHISRRKIRRSAGNLRGRGKALAGLILGYSGTVLLIAAILIP